MSRISQWVKVPPGASRSRTVTARERVPAGTPERSIGGEMSAPSQVKRRGTVPPSRYAGLVTVRWWATGALVSALSVGEAAPVVSPVPPPQPVAAIRTTAAITKLLRMPAR